MPLTNEDLKWKSKLEKNFNEEMSTLVEEMKKRNNRPRNMEYFDKILVEMSGKRLEEIGTFKEEGGKVFGIFCMFVPEELFYAAGAMPLRLFAGFQDSVRTAETVLPRNLCPLVKSTCGCIMLKLGYYGICDSLVYPTTCDCKKKTGEIIVDYMPDTRVMTMELPHTANTTQARKLWLTEIELLKKKIEEIMNVKITKKKLKDTICLVNSKRRAVRRLCELRKAERPPISGSDAMYVTVLSFYDDIRRWTEKAEELCEELEERIQNNTSTLNIDAPRIMVAGCPIVPPNWKIPNLIEDLGAVITCDELCTGARGLWDLVETCEWTMDDMLIALAERYLTLACACFTPNNNRIERILNWVKDYNVDGVVYHALHACHLYGIEAFHVRKALEKARIPMLTIETDYGDDIGQLRTRVEAFLEIIRARKFARAEKFRAKKP